MKHYPSRKIKLALVFLAFVTWQLTFQVICLAAETKEVESEAVGYHYQNIFPENQLSKGDYFDLLVKPGQEQELETEIINDSDEEITLTVAVNNATTNGMGVMEFGENDLKHTPAFTYKLTDMIEAPKEITLKAHQRDRLTFKLKVPNEDIKGIVLGGVELQKKQKEKKVAQGFAVRTEFVNTFSISLQMNQDKIEPDFSLNSVKYQEEMTKPSLMVSINNDRPLIVTNLWMEAIVRNKETDEVMTEFTLRDAKMAPLSIMEVPIELEDYEAGNYTVETTLKLEEREWSWKQEFLVPNHGGEETKASNVNGAEPVEQSTKLGPVMILTILFIMSVIILYVILRKG